MSHESFNFASISNLPVIFVCENNYFSVYTHLDERQPKRSIEAIGKAHNINTTKLGGNDVFDVNANMKIIIDDVRNNMKPHLVILETYRYREHCGPNFDDHLNYRDPKEVDYWMTNDPIKITEEKILNNKVLTQENINDFKIEINKNLNDIFEEALRSPLPNNDDAKKYIYA